MRKLLLPGNTNYNWLFYVIVDRPKHQKIEAYPLKGIWYWYKKVCRAQHCHEYFAWSETSELHCFWVNSIELNTMLTSFFPIGTVVGISPIFPKIDGALVPRLLTNDCLHDGGGIWWISKAKTQKWTVSSNCNALHTLYYRNNHFHSYRVSPYTLYIIGYWAVLVGLYILIKLPLYAKLDHWSVCLT